MIEVEPQDIKRQWLNVARRMQSVSKTEGWAIVGITVLVDECGCPRLWLSPTCKKIEPKLTAPDILRMLTEELDKSETK